MRQLRLTAFAVALLLYAGSGFAATAGEFYIDLLAKGIAQYNAATYAEAAASLRTAAFGLLEATDRYQTAQIYRALVADKLSDQNSARDAARRVLAAERIQRTYASLSLPAAVRSAFEAVAKKTLAPAELSSLTSSAPPPQQQTSSAPEKKPVVQETKPKANPTPSKPAQVKPPETKPEPKPAQVKPPETKPEPKPAQVKPPETKPPVTKPAPAVSKPAPVTPTPQPVNVTQQLTAADKALGAGDLAEARRLYRQLSDATLTHEQAMRVAEGAYRARDFSNVLRAFDRAGALRKGEEPYRFYLAVAYYETGKFAAAKKELTAALNYIELTPDVARYRDKIEGAAD